MRRYGVPLNATGKKMAEWAISRLSKAHVRSGFFCGKALLDSFLRLHVSQYEKRHLARTYVATEPESLTVVGYYTLAAGGLDPSLLSESVRKKLPDHSIPTFHLGRLAVDTKWRGQRLGETLLLHACGLALVSSEKVGIFGIDVWAIDEEAAAFYRKYGFVRLEDHPQHLLLSLKTFELSSQT